MNLREAMAAHPKYVLCARLGRLCIRLDRELVQSQLDDLDGAPLVSIEIDHDHDLIEIQDNEGAP